MKSFMTIAAVALCAVALWMPAPASAQTGDYEWTISSSDTDPDVNTGPDPAPGLFHLYLWNRGCAGADGPGMSAAEFEVNVTGAAVLAYVTMNGALNAGAGNGLLLAIGGCPVGPLPMIDILLSPSGAGMAAGLGYSVANGIAGTVDCQTPVPSLHEWPSQTRFVGFASAGYGGVRQDHGNGCTADLVEDTSWGSLKALYR